MDSKESSSEATPTCLLRAQDVQTRKAASAHPWNDASRYLQSQLSRSVGMSRAIVVHVTLPPGKESFVPHTHEREEEWLYILAGEGSADVDGSTYTVRAGDFLGFSTPSVVHHLRNTSDQDLVYLMGGECLHVETSDFPTLGKRKVRIGNNVEVFDRR